MHEANILDSSASKCLLQWTPNYKNYWAGVNSLRLIGCYKSLMFMQLHPRRNTREQARNIITMTITDWCTFDNENSIEDWCEWAGVSECGCALEWMWVCACVTEPPREWVSLSVCVHNSVCLGGGSIVVGGEVGCSYYISFLCIVYNKIGSTNQQNICYISTHRRKYLLNYYSIGKNICYNTTHWRQYMLHCYSSEKIYVTTRLTTENIC